MLSDKSVHICVGLIIYGDSDYALETLAALKQQDLDEGTNISVVLIDNGVPEALKSEILTIHQKQALYLKNFENLGFSAAANQCLQEALEFKADFLLLLNPDLLLDTVAIRELLRAAAKQTQIDFFTPKLMRANPDLSPTEPPVIDACGMLINKDIRHLDRGSERLDTGQYQNQEQVFGGTGACLMIRLSSATKYCLPRNNYEKDLLRIYPQLQQNIEKRPQLFDEAFFAYREDADLALRVQLLGGAYLYCPLAVGHHVRRVLPDNRSQLPKEINFMGVRNRFLLQINNLRLFLSMPVSINGFLKRNLIVIAAVLIKERSSLRSFKDLWILRKRAFANRKYIFSRSNNDTQHKVAKWFVSL